MIPGEDFVLAEIAAPSRIPPDQGRSPVSDGAMKSLILTGQQYIQNLGNGQEELYDLEHDPSEKTDLSGLPENELVLEYFRQSLKQALSPGS